MYNKYDYNLIGRLNIFYLSSDYSETAETSTGKKHATFVIWDGVYFRLILTVTY